MLWCFDSGGIPCGCATDFSQLIWGHAFFDSASGWECDSIGAQQVRAVRKADEWWICWWVSQLWRWHLNCNNWQHLLVVHGLLSSCCGLTLGPCTDTSYSNYLGLFGVVQYDVVSNAAVNALTAVVSYFQPLFSPHCSATLAELGAASVWQRTQDVLIRQHFVPHLNLTFVETKGLPPPPRERVSHSPCPMSRHGPDMFRLSKVV